jgi:hypothetical protein
MGISGEKVITGFDILSPTSIAASLNSKIILHKLYRQFGPCFFQAQSALPIPYSKII